MCRTNLCKSPCFSFSSTAVFNRVLCWNLRSVCHRSGPGPLQTVTQFYGTLNVWLTEDKSFPFRWRTKSRNTTRHYDLLKLKKPSGGLPIGADASFADHFTLMATICCRGNKNRRCADSDGCWWNIRRIRKKEKCSRLLHLLKVWGLMGKSEAV